MADSSCEVVEQHGVDGMWEMFCLSLLTWNDCQTETWYTLGTDASNQPDDKRQPVWFECEEREQRKVTEPSALNYAYAIAADLRCTIFIHTE